MGTSSGTSALHTAFTALDIGPGDEVITVPNTFIATVEAISLCGATHVFVDVDEKTYTMDLTVSVSGGTVTATLVGRKFWEFWK